MRLIGRQVAMAAKTCGGYYLEVCRGGLPAALHSTYMRSIASCITLQGFTKIVREVAQDLLDERTAEKKLSNMANADIEVRGATRPNV